MRKPPRVSLDDGEGSKITISDTDFDCDPDSLAPIWESLGFALGKALANFENAVCHPKMVLAYAVEWYYDLSDISHDDFYNSAITTKLRGNRELSDQRKQLLEKSSG